MSGEYKTVAEAVTASFTEKKSEFIGSLAPCQTEEQALAFIENIRKLHRKATHNCYAYILRHNNIGRHSDDGEPSGTAGAPMLEVLKKEGLTDVCCVVSRYFGGILLGAGGLVRAYGNGVKTAVDAARIKIMKPACLMSIALDYSLYGKIGKLLSDYDVRIQDENFAADVKITLYIHSEKSEEFKSELIDLCFGRVSIESLGERRFDFGK